MGGLSHPLSCGFEQIEQTRSCTAYATMPPHQDRYEVSLELVTIAGTEYAMQADLSQNEDVAELEDDILCFLPTVSDLEVFGCELELLDLHTQQLLTEAFHTVLLQRPQLQFVVRLCMVDGHSIWQFQEDGKESYPKAVRVPANPRGEIADRAFHAAPSLRHVEVAMGIQHAGFAAWQSCQQLQIVKLPPSVISLAEGTFQGCYVLREVAAPGCVQYSRRVFAECCSLGRVGVSHETEDSNVLAPGAQLDKYAFETCLTLTTITFDMDHTNKPRALPEGAFFVAQALNSSVCRVTSTISGRGPVKIAKDLWRSTSWAQKSQPCSLPHLPTV